MITILTSDGRTLSYEETEQVLILGNWGAGRMSAKNNPVLDVRPGNWLYLPSQRPLLNDRDFDLVLVRNVAGRPLREGFTEFKARLDAEFKARLDATKKTKARKDK